MKRVLFWAAVASFVLAVAVNFSAWNLSRGSTGAQLFVSQQGYCFIERGSGGFIPLKLTRSECFGPFLGDHWCENLGYTRCIYNKAEAPVAAPTPAPTPVAPTNEPAAPTSPTPTPTPQERPGGYLNEPFGTWPEPGLCLSSDQRQFEIFAYKDTEDCFEKLENPQVCDYLGQCFTRQRDLVDYLKTFTQ